jgi:hypothetical protein
MATIDPRATARFIDSNWHDGLAGQGTAGRRRIALVLTVLVAMALAAWLGEPRPSILADPDLTFLLRGMALIKAAIAAAIFGLVFWQADNVTSSARLAAYVIATAALAATAVLVWQLAVLQVTSIVFHATLLGLGVLALGDVRIKGSLRRR